LTCDITAASASFSDVQAAINSASDGQVVCIPAGAANWGGSVAEPGVVFTYSKAITLIFQNICGNWRLLMVPLWLQPEKYCARYTILACANDQAKDMAGLKKFQFISPSGALFHKCICHNEL
jgi:hypothetical protein